MTVADAESEILIKAISNEIRRNIIRLLMGKSMTYTEIAHLLSFNLKKESGKFNFHLKELIQADIIINTADLYQLTPTGEEMYYLLLDIEKDKEIDPHGMMTALIRLEDRKEFWFYTSTLGMIGSLWAVMIGLLGLFAFDNETILILYGSALIIIGLVVGIFTLRYYTKTVTQLLGGQSRRSILLSSIFMLSIQWYLIRSKKRVGYMVTSFILLFSWFLTIMTGLLHLVEGPDSVGTILYWLDGIAILGSIAGLIMLRRLYSIQ